MKFASREKAFGAAIGEVASSSVAHFSKLGFQSLTRENGSLTWEGNPASDVLPGSQGFIRVSISLEPLTDSSTKVIYSAVMTSLYWSWFWKRLVQSGCIAIVGLALCPISIVLGGAIFLVGGGLFASRGLVDMRVDSGSAALEKHFWDCLGKECGNAIESSALNTELLLSEGGQYALLAFLSWAGVVVCGIFDHVEASRIVLVYVGIPFPLMAALLGVAHTLPFRFQWSAMRSERVAMWSIQTSTLAVVSFVIASNKFATEVLPVAPVVEWASLKSALLQHFPVASMVILALCLLAIPLIVPWRSAKSVKYEALLSSDLIGEHLSDVRPGLLLLFRCILAGLFACCGVISWSGLYCLGEILLTPSMAQNLIERIRTANCALLTMLGVTGPSGEVVASTIAIVAVLGVCAPWASFAGLVIARQAQKVSTAVRLRWSSSHEIDNAIAPGFASGACDALGTSRLYIERQMAPLASAPIAWIADVGLVRSVYVLGFNGSLLCKLKPPEAAAVMWHEVGHAVAERRSLGWRFVGIVCFCIWSRAWIELRRDGTKEEEDADDYAVFRMRSVGDLQRALEVMINVAKQVSTEGVRREHKHDSNPLRLAIGISGTTNTHPFLQLRLHRVKSMARSAAAE